MKPVAVLVHVTDIESALSWYRTVFPSAKLTNRGSNDLAILEIDGFGLELVKADDKVRNGKNGSVLYWHVSDLDVVLDRFIAFGAKLYRGPISI